METKTPLWFWILSIIFLLWNLIGIGSFVAQILMTPEALEALPKAERELYDSYPSWTYIVYFIAVFAGFLGSLGLLLKKRWARTLFLVSLLAVLIQMGHSLFVANALEVYGNEALILPVIVTIISIMLLWFANFCAKKPWYN